MRKPLTSIFFLFLITIPSLYAQQLPKTLLWRISGNGLSKPSYLFGTMHIYDPRIFSIGDSLLNAISSTDGFANELDLNLITPMMTDMIREIATPVSLKDMISKKAYDEYAPALARKFKKPVDEITSVDILKEKNRWVDEGFNGKKMKTFLDAYLTELADKQGKWIGGIEDFADQKGLITSLIDGSDIKQMILNDGSGKGREIDNLTTLYLNGDLEGFQRFINGLDSNYRDLLLIKRNHKMARRMDSLAHVRSTVFAIGAAHLPGEEGVIQLLRARGFSVDPVFSSKRVKPEDYQVHEVVRPWVEVKDPDGLYKVMMPGTPGNVRMFGLLSMEMYYNIFNGTMYMTFSLPLPYSGHALDSTENAMLRQMFGGLEYKLEKKLEINGITGKSYIQKTAEGSKKAYLFNKAGYLYFAFGYSASDAAASLQAIDRFFDSYQPLLPTVTANTYDYTDSTHYYSITLPAAPHLVENLPVGDKNLHTTLMVCADPETGSYLFFGCTDCRKGYVFRDDSNVLRITHDNLIQKYSSITLDTSYSKENRRVLDVDGTLTTAAMKTKTRITVRGNRYYSVLLMYPTGKWNERLEKMLNSFQLIEYPAGHWFSRNAPDSLFTAWAPADFNFPKKEDSSRLAQANNYECFDSNRVAYYIMQTDTLDLYFWRKTDTAFWHYERGLFLKSTDTLLSETLSKKDGMYQYEIQYRPLGGNNVTRLHMWLRGNLVYRMKTVQEPETIGDENVNRFYGEFHFNRPAEESRVFQSKAALLLHDLNAADTLVSRPANKALSDMLFDSTDIPLLREALLKAYPADSMLSNSTNGQVAENIILLNDSSSVPFAREHFLKVSTEDQKDGLLDIMSAWPNSANYDTLGRLLASSAVKYRIPEWISSRWHDSLELASHLFPGILPLLADSLQAPAIINLAGSLLRDSLISIAIFRPWQHSILHYAEQRFLLLSKDSLSYSGADYSLIQLLQLLKTDSSNGILKKWQTIAGADYLKQEVLLSLLKNGQPISAKAVFDLAANKNTAIELYGHLKKYKKSLMFPAKYLTQAYFAECMARNAGDEYFDGDETNLRFIRVAEMKWHGKLSRFFFYDLSVQGNDEHRLVAAGPFNMDKINVSYTEANAAIYEDEKYDPYIASEQMKALVLQMGKK